MMRIKFFILNVTWFAVLAGAGAAHAQIRIPGVGLGLFPNCSSDYDESRAQSLHNSSYGNVHQVASRFFFIAPRYSATYKSKRSPHKFAGATQVILTNFDPMNKNSQTAFLRLDKNDVTFSAFGEPRITIVYYRTFKVKLICRNRLDFKETGPCIFSVQMPKEYANLLGKSSFRLVVTATDKSQPRCVRLLLINPKGIVTQTLELRPLVNWSEDIRF